MGTPRSTCRAPRPRRCPPSVTMPMSALVPPMSKVISRSRPGEVCRPGPAEHAGGGAGQQQRHRALGAPSRCVATPPFDIITCSSPRRPRRRSAAVQLAEVASDLRADERVHARGGEALELAELRRDVGAGRHERVGQLLPDDRRRPPLVRRVEIGEQEAHGDRFHALVAQLARRAAHLVLVERHEHLARGRNDPLGDDLAMTTLDERPRLPRDVLHDRVVLRPLVAADVDDVTKALVVTIPVRAPVCSRTAFVAIGRPVEDGADLRRSRSLQSRRARRCRSTTPGRDRQASSGPCARRRRRVSGS